MAHSRSNFSLDRLGRWHNGQISEVHRDLGRERLNLLQTAANNFFVSIEQNIQSEQTGYQVTDKPESTQKPARLIEKPDDGLADNISLAQQAVEKALNNPPFSTGGQEEQTNAG